MGTKTKEILEAYKAELIRTLGERGKDIKIWQKRAWIYVEFPGAVSNW